MPEELEKLLEEANQTYRRAVELRSKGLVQDAKQHYLAASEKLLLAAKISNGVLRDSRKALAEKLLQEAESMTAHRPGIKPVSVAKPGSVTKEVQTEDDVREFTMMDRPGVTFDDVAGLEDVKEQIRIKLLYPFTHPEIAEKYRISPGGGILLFGPPGTGKTLIARAVAGEIDAAFFAIKPSEIMEQWVGKSEENIANLFRTAGSYPLSVVFIDEMEALAPRRRSSRSTVMQRVVPQLLAELDGFNKRQNPMLFIGATNEPWAIDSAILRPGRLDRLIYVAPPDLEARQKILELNLAGIELKENVYLNQVAAATEGFSGADMANLALRVREDVFTEAIQNGIARAISQMDLDAVVKSMKPSIQAKDLKRFEEFKANR